MLRARTLFLLTFLTLTLAGCFDATPKKNLWQLQSQATETSIDFIELEKFSQNISLMSGGRLEIIVHPGGFITGGPDIISAVSEGRIEMGNGWPNWWSGQNPAWAVMNAGPFDFMNLDASMMFFLAGEGSDLANQLAAPLGVLWRPAWWSGMEFGLLSRQPVNGLDDLKGKRIRIGPGLPSEVLTEAAGSYAIPLVPSEIEPALRAGDLDAVEWTTAAGVWDLGLQEISPYAIVPAIWQPSVLSDFLINKQAYDQLSPDLQAMLETAIRAYTLTTTFKAKLKDFQALESLKKQGLSFRRWSARDIKRWRAANDKVLQRYTDRDPYIKQLITKKRTFRDEYNRYYEYFGPYD
jgi:TRAP-type mannitol/chloroaromatic compound transport system substrate-binding protein